MSSSVRTTTATASSPSSSSSSSSSALKLRMAARSPRDLATAAAAAAAPSPTLSLQSSPTSSPFSSSPSSSASASPPPSPSPSSSPSPTLSPPSPCSPPSAKPSTPTTTTSSRPLWVPATPNLGAKEPILAPRPADARLIVRLFGHAYDLTDFKRRHPGGSVALEQLHGQDATDVFLVYHPDHIVAQAQSANTPSGPCGLFRSMRIADDPDNPTPSKPYTRSPMQQDFDDIIARLKADGKFKASRTYYLTKVACQLLLLVATVLLLLAGNHMHAMSSASTSASLHHHHHHPPLSSPLAFASSPTSATTTTTVLRHSSSTSPSSSLLMRWYVPTYAVAANSTLYHLLLTTDSTTSAAIDGTFAMLTSWWTWFVSSLTWPSLASLALHSLSAFTLGMFWQQIAFLGHDAGHNQITGYQRNEYVFAWLVTAFFGVSGMWWKRNHNVHHIHTNSIECDPDIQHLPVFAIDSLLFRTFFSTYYKFKLRIDAMARWFVSRQHKLFYVVMSIARLNLYVQSIALLLHPFIPTPNRFRELGALACFWTWHVLLLSQLPTAASITWYVLLSHAVCGLIHVQITLSHFAMPAYFGASMCPGDVDHFFRTQFASTMNVSCPAWLDWLHGGLQFQLEHHLLPRLPRHHLRYCMDMYIKPFARKHGLEYHERDFITANRLLLERLRITAAVMQEECRKKRKEGKFEGFATTAEAMAVSSEAAVAAAAAASLSPADSQLWQALMAQG